MPAINQTLTDTLTHAHDAPWQHGFMPLMREIEAKSAHLPKIGEANRLHQENFTLGQTPSLAFAPREIADIDTDNGITQINVFSLGMLGPQGPLPLHFTEMVKDRMDNHHDDTLSHFLNLFHHRALSLHYRAWAKSQATASLDRADDEQFAQYIWALSGVEPQQTDHLPAHSYLANAPHFIHQQQNPDALAKAISHYFNVPVTVRPYQFHWLHLSEEDQSRIGKPASPSQIGMNAVIGQSVPDVQQRLTLEIGPLCLADYHDFLPNGRHIHALLDLMHSLIGYDYQWDIALSIKADTIPMAHLDNTVQMGRTAWINQQDQQPNTAIADMRYSPDVAISYTKALS